MDDGSLPVGAYTRALTRGGGTPTDDRRLVDSESWEAEIERISARIGVPAGNSRTTAHARKVYRKVNRLWRFDGRGWRLLDGPARELADEAIRDGRVTCRLAKSLPLVGNKDELVLINELVPVQQWNVAIHCWEDSRIEDSNGNPPAYAGQPTGGGGGATKGGPSWADLRDHPDFGFLVQAAKAAAGGWIDSDEEFQRLVREEYDRLAAMAAGE